MSDLHFILRHALTGAVLISFLVAGLWPSAPDQAEMLISYVNRNSSSGVSALILSLVASVPILGVVIQGLHIIVLHLGGRLFSDQARVMMSRVVRDAYVSGIDQKLHPEDWRKNLEILRSSPDGALYVWVYHTIAPAHPIDWARRRRSYYYLGINLSIAAGLSFIVGYALGIKISSTNTYVLY